MDFLDGPNPLSEMELDDDTRGEYIILIDTLVGFLENAYIRGVYEIALGDSLPIFSGPDIFYFLGRLQERLLHDDILNTMECELFELLYMELAGMQKRLEEYDDQ